MAKKNVIRMILLVWPYKEIKHNIIFTDHNSNNVYDLRSDHDPMITTFYE